MSLATRNQPPDPGPSRSPQRSRLLELPDELLLSIARRLFNNKDLCQLSLVCRKLRNVAQEALVKEILLPPYGMRELIRTLCDRPDLCGKINSVDLGDYVRTGHPQYASKLDEWSHFSKCRELVGDDVFNQILRFVEDGDGVHLLWSKDDRFFLDVFIASCSNIKEMSLRFPASEQGQLQVALGQQTAKLVDPFTGILRGLLGKRLQVLEIRETDTYKMFKTPNVTLAHLSNLVRLSVPADALIYMARKATSVREALPSSLQHLQLKPCNRFILQCLPPLATACQNGVLPKLHQIDLHFHASLRDSLLLIDQGRGFLQPLRGVVDLLKRNYGTVLRGYNRYGVYTGDLPEELDARSLLSDFERWCPTKKDEEYSSIVARTQEGAPRRKTQEEIRAFVRRDQPTRPTTKTRKCIFKPNVGLQGTATLSFSADMEEPPKIVEPKFTSEFTRWLSSLAAKQRMAEPALGSLPVYLLDWPQSLGVWKELFITNTTYNHPGQGEYYRVLEFRPNDWLGVQFFGNALPFRSRGAVQSKTKYSRKRNHNIADVARGGPGPARCVRAKFSDGK